MSELKVGIYGVTAPRTMNFNLFKRDIEIKRKGGATAPKSMKSKMGGVELKLVDNAGKGVPGFMS